MDKRQTRDALWEERTRLAQAEHAAGRRPFDNPRIHELDKQVEEMSSEISVEFEASADLSVLQAEEQVLVPKSVLEFLLNTFESGLCRAEHLRCASDSKDVAYLAAIKLCYDQPSKDATEELAQNIANALVYNNIPQSVEDTKVEVLRVLKGGVPL